VLLTLNCPPSAQGGGEEAPAGATLGADVFSKVILLLSLALASCHSCVWFGWGGGGASVCHIRGLDRGAGCGKDGGVVFLWLKSCSMFLAHSEPTNVSTHTRAYMHTHQHPHPHPHPLIYTHINTHTHTHTCTNVRQNGPRPDAMVVALQEALDSMQVLDWGLFG
jgi:hypothetical protein